MYIQAKLVGRDKLIPVFTELHTKVEFNIELFRRISHSFAELRYLSSYKITTNL